MTTSAPTLDSGTWSRGSASEAPASATGTCRRDAIDTYEIPDDYEPVRRHADAPPIPRPDALLCRQHAAKVIAQRVGNKLDAGSHEAQCSLCQHPERALIERLWTGWVKTAGDLICEFDVSERAFYRHADHFDLWTLKARSVRGQYSEHAGRAVNARGGVRSALHGYAGWNKEVGCER